MKLKEFYTLSDTTFGLHGVYMLVVQFGYRINENIALIKENDNQWRFMDIQYGCKISKKFKSKKEALDYFKESDYTYENLRELRNHSNFDKELLRSLKFYGKENYISEMNLWLLKNILNH